MLRVGLCYLREYKSRHHFPDWLNPIRECGKDIKTTKHFLIHCHDFMNERQTLVQNIK